MTKTNLLKLLLWFLGLTMLLAVVPVFMPFSYWFAVTPFHRLRIWLRCRAMALFRKIEMSQSTGQVTIDLACNSNERNTLVSLS